MFSGCIGTSDGDDDDDYSSGGDGIVLFMITVFCDVPAGSGGDIGCDEVMMLLLIFMVTAGVVAYMFNWQ